LEISADSANTRPPDFQFVSDWSGENAGELRQSALAGTTLIVRPAASCPQQSLRSLLALPDDPAAGLLALDASPAGWSVIPEENHPANQLFRSGDFGNPFGGIFRERLKLPASLATESQIRPIALFSDGIPALLEQRTENASILIWNLPLDPAKTDWPIQGSFLPAIAELLLRTRTHGTDETSYVLPGSPLTWTSNDPAHAGAITLIGSTSEPMAISESTTPEGTLWQSTLPATPGLHRWQISGQAIAFTAVNFPDSESDLRPLDANPAFGKTDSQADSLVRQAALARGLQLWPWLVLTALLALAMESIIHSRSVTRSA
jgi:hypothetical protein